MDSLRSPPCLSLHLVYHKISEVTVGPRCDSYNNGMSEQEVQMIKMVVVMCGRKDRVSEIELEEMVKLKKRRWLRHQLAFLEKESEPSFPTD